MTVVGAVAAPPTAIRKHEGDGYGAKIVVLRTDDLAQTFERRFAPMCKGYRVLHTAKEIPK